MDVKNHRPIEVKATHLARKAVVYARQSTNEQVEMNVGSTEFQRDQTKYPLRWGWPAESIELVDDDLGLSGSAAGHRGGYQRILAAIERDEVGAIFVSDVSRLGRDAQDLYHLLSLCRVRDTLLVINGRVADTKDNIELLKLRIEATIAEHENLRRRDHLVHGRITRAASGHAVSAPPRGYVAESTGNWIKDPDTAVRVAIEAVFRIFQLLRSCKRTVMELIAKSIRLSRRSQRWGVIWTQPTVAQVYIILRHPAYMGTYVFRRCVTDPRCGRDGKGRLRSRPAHPDEVILVPNHHEPYVSQEEWNSIQEILCRNANSKKHQALGKGAALVQGIVRCGPHKGRAMSTVYKAPLPSGRRPHAYFCLGDYFDGGGQCGRVPGHTLDEAVRAAVFERLQVPRLELIREGFERACKDERAEQRRVDVELHRARQTVQALEDHFVAVDPANTFTKRNLEAKLEAALREVDRLQKAAAAQGSAVPSLDDRALQEIIQLCSQLEGLWNAPTTTDRDRKEIIRILIREVRIEERDDELLRVRIVWTDDEPDTVIEVKREGFGRNLIIRLAAEGRTAKEIAQHLNDLGILTRRGTPWTALVISRRLHRLQNRRNG